ncbi:MAG: porin [Planctomycetaceae bacterium]|nr:porin [Planctomycetaceae bacterium]
MKKTIFGCLGAAAVAFALQFTPANVQASFFGACDPCGEGFCGPCDDAWANPCDPCGTFNGCGTKAGKWFLNGHIESGFFANSNGNTSTYGEEPWDLLGRGADVNSGNSARLQNVRLTGAQINQVYVSMGRKVDGKRGLDLGGKLDFTWGSDAYQVQSGGMEQIGEDRWGSGDYFAAFSQAYIELEYKRLNVKAGKYYAPLGIDSYLSTENFFYSWSSMNSMVPTTAGGVLATYKASDRFSLLGGWMMPDEIGQSSKNNYLLGGFDWKLGRKNRVSIDYVFGVGKNTYGENDFDAFIHTLKVKRNLSKRLSSTFAWTLVNENTSEGAQTATWSLANEFIYKYNDRWSFGLRTGTVRDEMADLDWYSITLGSNWAPNKWLTVKPEIRYDWLENGETEQRLGGGSNYQFSGGVSAVVKF